jgi:hypothetical protein
VAAPVDDVRRPGARPVDPQVSEKRKREGIIRFRVNSAEEKGVKSFAARHQITPGQLARDLVLRGIASDAAPVMFDNRSKTTRDVLIKLEELATIGRKRLIAPKDLQRLIVELQRIQVLILRFYAGPRD